MHSLLIHSASALEE